MANIILAYIIGVICGISYMYLRYRNMLKQHLKELEQIKLNHAKLEGQIQTLNVINGIEDEGCT